MRARWARAGLAAGILAVVLADAGVVVARAGGGRSSPAAAETVPAPLPGNLVAVLPELEAFVEQARGLRFLRPPKVQLVADKAFEELLMADDSGGAGESSGDADAFLGVLHTLGLVGDHVDLGAVAQGQAAEVVGFYDSEKELLYVRGVDPTPYARMVLVHELTHALQDQHFRLDRPELKKADDDSVPAWDALVEGDATIVEQQWHDSRPRSEQEAIDAADSSGAGGAGGSEPDVFARMFTFPYAVGPRFVAAVRAAGGQARLDAAFREPPTTTEQVLHPERFLAGEGRRRVEAPAADGKVVDQGALGELGLILVTGTAAAHDPALVASMGWAGDRYRAWKQAGRTCIRWSIQMDTPRDSTELVSVMRAWAAKYPGATVQGTDPVVVTSCR